jgi:hypothetical protein
MGAKQTKPSVTANPVNGLPYTSAGCVFTDSKLFLAGYQPNKKKPCISGLGGSKKKGEIPQETAIRETLEELFHLKKVPHHLINSLLTIIPQKTTQNGSYVMFIYSFAQLEEILGACSGLVSPLYTTIPTSLIDLLLHRKPNTKAEISHLCLLPLVKHNSEYPFIYLGLFRDMMSILP